MTTSDRLWRLYAYSWWILCPAFFLLVLRFSYERACLDPYELLRPLMRHQSLALIVAAIYTGAHAWILTTGVLLARTLTAGANRPMIVSVDLKVVAMAAVIALEQMPRAAWEWLYRSGGICGS